MIMRNNSLYIIHKSADTDTLAENEPVFQHNREYFS